MKTVARITSGHLRDGRPVNTLAQFCQPQPPLTAVVVLATPLSRDREFLRQKVQERELQLVEVTTCREVLSAIGDFGPTAVFCDEELPWQELLSYLAGSCHCPRIIVVAGTTCERLCAEVVNLAGFDVLAKPFGVHEVEWLLSAAFALPHSLRKLPATEDSAPAAALATRLSRFSFFRSCGSGAEDV